MEQAINDSGAGLLSAIKPWDLGRALGAFF